jgi:hypothetical protein
MRGAALGLSWEIVARHRWLYKLGALCFVIACAVVALLPASLRSPELGGWLALPMLLVAVSITTAASFSEKADLRSSRSGFPRRLFTLPASSFTLASVPFALGAALPAALWVVVAVGLLHPCGADAPLVYPALAVAATVAWMQAFTWTPFPLPWLRVLLLFVGCYGLLMGPFVLVEIGVSQGLISASLAGLLVLCYLVALVGVRLGRRGVLAGERVQVDRGTVGEASVLPAPFSSPLRAQLWIEWRYFGWVSVVQLFVLVFGVLPLIHFLEVAWSRPFMLAATGPAQERMGSAWVALQVLLLLPLGFSMIGGDVSRQSAPAKTGLWSFYATRAVSNPEIVKAKLLTMAGFVLVLWAQMLAVTLGWAAAAGHLGDMMERLGDLAGFPGSGPAVLAAGVVVACVVNWLWLVGNLWIGLSGRAWVAGATLLLTMALLVGIAQVVTWWRPAWYPWLVAFVAAGLTWKVVAVGWACRKLLARGYATPGLLAALVAGWAIVVGALAGLAAWLFPGGWLTFAGVVLVIPLATSLLAPVALAWDRHR